MTRAGHAVAPAHGGRDLAGAAGQPDLRAASDTREACRPTVDAHLLRAADRPAIPGNGA